MNNQPVVNPTTNGSGFPPAEFVAELLVAGLNWQYQSLYAPWFDLWLNSQWTNLSNPFCGGLMNQVLPPPPHRASP